LLSPRSMSEIIERLTPLLPASASSERPCAARRPRTRKAIRWFRSGALSSIVDILSNIMEKRQVFVAESSAGSGERRVRLRNLAEVIVAGENAFEASGVVPA